MPCRIQLDDIVFQLQKVGGISTYWRELTARLSTYPEIAVKHGQGKKAFRMLPVWSTADVFHSSYFRLPYSIGGTKAVITVYDMIYEINSRHLRSRQKLGFWQRKHAIHNADAIICISQNTRDDLLRIYPDLAEHCKVVVIHLAPSYSIDMKNDAPQSHRLTRMIEISPHYVLFVGARHGYKNFRGALQGFARSQLPALGFRLVCTGAPLEKYERDMISHQDMTNHVQVFEHATDDEMVQLYCHALALVYPSFYEGFGLPVLEAMNCGCPVIVAHRASLPEVVEDAGVFINPEEPESISRAFDLLLADSERILWVKRGFLQSNKFSWDTTVKKHVDLYLTLSGK